MLMALLKSFRILASLLPISELLAFLTPIPTPLPKIPPDKVGPTNNTGFFTL